MNCVPIKSYQVLKTGQGKSHPMPCGNYSLPHRGFYLILCIVETAHCHTVVSISYCALWKLLTATSRLLSSLALWKLLTVTSWLLFCQTPFTLRWDQIANHRLPCNCHWVVVIGVVSLCCCQLPLLLASVAVSFIAVSIVVGSFRCCQICSRSVDVSNVQCLAFFFVIVVVVICFFHYVFSDSHRQLRYRCNYGPCHSFYRKQEVRSHNIVADRWTGIQSPSTHGWKGVVWGCWSWDR